MNEEVNKNYRIITRDIIGKLNIDETYVFMWLLFKSDYETWESHVLRSTLCKVTGFKDEETITRYTNKFHKSGFLTDKNCLKSYNGEKGRIQTYMTYKINAPTHNWVRFKYDLLEEDIPYSLKAFLVLLKCLCLNNTNACLYSKAEIARQLNIDRGKVADYIRLGIEHNKIIADGKTHYITDSNIVIDLPKKWENCLQEKYNLIKDYCISQNVIPPPFNELLMRHIYVMRFSCPEEKLYDDMINKRYSNSKENYEFWSLKANLQQHCKKLPEKISSLQYFIKAIFGKTKQPARPKPAIRYYVDETGDIVVVESDDISEKICLD